MSKSDRISAFLENLALPPPGVEAGYQGYFHCFNSGLYYEAHDVLEQLWLRERGGNYAFYKGLIQVAGAFVHLQKQSLRPEHPKDGRRLHPAARLFDLAAANLQPYRPKHLFLDVDAVCALCARTAEKIRHSAFRENPWNPATAPQIDLEFPRDTQAAS